MAFSVWPLHSILRKDWSKNAEYIILTVFEALKFAHSKNVYHMDVRPGNIIVVGVQEGKVNVMLSEWGSSVDGGKGMTLTKFCGCTPYAHDRLLGKKCSFKLGADLDFASLAYTIDHVETGKLQWLYEFNRPSQVTTADLKKRHAFVSKWLLKSTCDVIRITTQCDVINVITRAMNTIATRHYKVIHYWTGLAVYMYLYISNIRSIAKGYVLDFKQPLVIISLFTFY